MRCVCQEDKRGGESIPGKGKGIVGCQQRDALVELKMVQMFREQGVCVQGLGDGQGEEINWKVESGLGELWMPCCLDFILMGSWRDRDGH